MRNTGSEPCELIARRDGTPLEVLPPTQACFRRGIPRQPIGVDADANWFSCESPDEAIERVRWGHHNIGCSPDFCLTFQSVRSFCV